MESRIHNERILNKEEMMFMYALGAEAHPPHTQNFFPELNTLHHLFRATLAPHIGDATTCPQYERNLIMFYVERNLFCVFDYIVSEIINISMSPLQSYDYAPQIMMMIEKISGITFVKDMFITDIKPQAPTKPIITQAMPPPAATPSTRSSTAPSSSSSSGSGLLKVLKSMFHMCRDTRQRQDILLSNQRHLHQKFKLEEFDEFPMVDPPLDDDPFASLTPTELAPMGVAAPGPLNDDDDDDDGSSDYEGEGEDDNE
jgi:hypothetical protein